MSETPSQLQTNETKTSPQETGPTQEGNDQQQVSSSLDAILGENFTIDQVKDDGKLAILFLLMVISGTGNYVFQKLQGVSMYNYPNFLNIYGCLVFLILTFAYIIPVARYGLFNKAITEEQMKVPKRKFAFLAILDTLSTSMQIFACVYLPGPLVVLLPQAAIPISMALSKQILGERYRWVQYFGAMVVLAGISLVLEPVLSKRLEPDQVCTAWNEELDCTICQEETTEDDCLSHNHSIGLLGSLSEFVTSDGNNDGPVCQWVDATDVHDVSSGSVVFWSIVMTLSFVPMTISSIFKESIMSDTSVEMDGIYMNGWIVLFQLFFSIIIAVPAGVMFSPPVQPQDFLHHLYDGMKCYMGTASIDTGCHPDDQCGSLFVNLFLLFNTLYTIVMAYMLKYGSANIFYLAMTLIVPLGNLVFALPFVPGHKVPHFTDVIGLVIIVTGLGLYRFGDSPKEKVSETSDGETTSQSPEPSLEEPLLDETEESRL